MSVNRSLEHFSCGLKTISEALRTHGAGGEGGEDLEGHFHNDPHNLLENVASFVNTLSLVGVAQPPYDDMYMYGILVVRILCSVPGMPTCSQCFFTQK